MAEILVPAIGLGFLWIISNQKNEEGYTNLQNRKNELANEFIKDENYSKDFYPTKLDKLTKNQKISSVQKYDSPNDETRKYFKTEFAKEQNKKNYKNRSFTSLTGDKVDPENFTHENMVPWFGSKVRQPLQNDRISENILDTFTGSGSQHFHKKATAPLFKPEKNMHLVHGAQNNNDFLQSRMNVSQKISGVKPFEQVYVAPGLNRGYESEGYGGYNAGMVSRENWMPKNVDELRVKTNPKQSYAGQILGPQAKVKNLGIQGSVEKYRPDTYYENCPDRWFTTTGLEKGQTLRSENIFKPENRANTTTEYYGNSYDTNNASYTKRNYLPDKRQDLPTDPIGNASRPNVWDSEKNNFNKEGFTILPNSRSLTGQTNTMGNINRGLWALATPVMDALRPTRKTNVIGNMRPVGNAKGHEEQKLYNRHQKPKSTIKEQYIENKYIPMGIHPHQGGYAVKDIDLKGVQRTSTQHSYIGNASSASRNSKPQTYESYDNQRVSNKDLLSVSRTNPGNMKLVNNNVNYAVRKEPICPENFGPAKLPASLPSVAALGQQSYKVNRGHFSNDSFADPSLVSALQSNPYAKSLSSVA